MAFGPLTGPFGKIPLSDPPAQRKTPNYMKDPTPGTGGPMVRFLGDMGNGRNGNGPGNRPGILSAFMPGQMGALSNQLATGFGGNPKQWRGLLGQTYSDMQMPMQKYGYRAPTNPNDGKPGNDKPDKPDGKPNDPGYDPWGHDRASLVAYPMQNWNPQAQAAMQAQAAQQAQQQAPMQTMAPPANSMIAAPGQGQQQMLSPQVIAMLRQRFGGMS